MQEQLDQRPRPVQEPRDRRPRGSWVAATIVGAAMLIAALAMWTAVPLTWIYIGSKLSKTQFPSGGPYMIVLVGIVVSILILAWLIGRLNNLYVRITGTNSVAPIRSTWLRSMRDTPEAQSWTIVEAVIVGSVLLAAVALGVWFLLLAGSPLPRG